MIVTYDSRTQTGKKWQKDSQDVITMRRKFAKYNRNESKVERYIGDVNYKITLVL